MKQRGTSLTSDALHRLCGNHAAMTGLFLICTIIIACLILPFVPGLLHEPNAMHLSVRNAPPSAQHWFGCDHLGRDIFSRVLFGGRISIAVGLITTFVSVAIGMVWGAAAGYAGGRTDAFMMRVVDILYSLPFLVIVILLGATLEPRTSRLTEWTVHLVAGNSATIEKNNHVRTAVEPLTTLIPLFLAIGALSWLTVSRVMRAQVQNIARQEYIEAARSLGLGHFWILFRHILPNTIGPVIVYTTLTIPGVMLFEAVLSFLGLGVKPPNSSWGILIKEGADLMLVNPWLLLFPSLFFVTTLLSFNFLGDGLRDAFDPKSSKG